MLNGRPLLLTMIVVSSFVSVSAQSAEEAVRKAQDAMFAAAAAGDKAAYEKLWADDLQWVTTEGAVIDKQKRLRRVQPQAGSQRSADNISIKVYGDVAVETARFTITEKGRTTADRVLPVFVQRNGSWQLLSHMQLPIQSSQSQAPR